MPSLPTSLILLGLVAAWLIVLVPMVAKRREHVPENDEDSAGFRVLRRATGALRRRPVLSRTARGMDRADETAGDEWADDVRFDELADDDGFADDRVDAERFDDGDASIEHDDDARVEVASSYEVDDFDGQRADDERIDDRRVDDGLDERFRDADADSEVAADEPVAEPAPAMAIVETAGMDGDVMDDTAADARDDDARDGYVRDEVVRDDVVRDDGARERDARVSDVTEHHGARGRSKVGAGMRTVRYSDVERDAADEWADEHPVRRRGRGTSARFARAAFVPDADETAYDRSEYDENAYDENAYDENAYDEVEYGREREYEDERGDAAPAGREYVARRRSGRDYEDFADREPDPRERDYDDPARYRRVPLRPGRGGYDPQAAERAKAYRYRQRRRVVMALLALTIIGAVVGWLGIALAWAATAVTGVLLALYLAYLRRQVRIEESIWARRAARAERARQIRPGYQSSVAQQVRAYRAGDGAAVDGDDYRVVSHARPTVPPVYRSRGVPVDLDDDAPDFDDLEYYEPMPYRRAVGQ